MKRFNLLLLLLFACIAINAQDTPLVIEAATDKNVFLFFPSPIAKALPGNDNFQFGYNTQNAENFGVLKALSTKGESTLHVITNDQTVYSFMLTYAETPKQYEYFFDGSEAVGNYGKPKEEPPAPNDTSKQSPLGQKIVDSDYFDEEVNATADMEFCKELINRKEYFRSLNQRTSDVVLHLTNIAYKDDKTFLVLTLENGSLLDYDINFVQFNKIAKKASKKATFQAIEVTPIPGATYNPFERVEAGQSQKAVYVFEKLSIDKNKLINIEINELKGERNIKLSVGHRFINNPNN